MYSERLARWQFWLLLIGFILTFGPMHFAGILGMPRRIFTYQADRPWQLWNVLTGIGSLIQAPSYLIFAWNFLISLWSGAPQVTTPGTPGPSNGRQPRLRRSITSRRFRRCAAAAPSGT